MPTSATPYNRVYIQDIETEIVDQRSFLRGMSAVIVGVVELGIVGAGVWLAWMCVAVKVPPYLPEGVVFFSIPLIYLFFVKLIGASFETKRRVKELERPRPRLD